MNQRYKWVVIELPETVGQWRKEMNAPDLLPGVPDDASICGGDYAASAPTIEFRRPWTPEEHEAEAARLRQIELEEQPDRKLGF